MGLLTEPDVTQFRVQYYRLLARLLAAEPDADLLEALAEGMDERALGAAQVHRTMGEGWRVLAGDLAGNPAGDPAGNPAGDALDTVTDGYSRLFLDPYGETLNPYESYYVAGKLYGGPLSEVREFMARQNLELGETDRREPEDALFNELDTMATLAERQQAGGDADPAAHVEAQREFLARHLLVWAPACVQDLEQREDSAFYRGVAMILRGFLEVERDFFHGDGGLEVEPLEEARRRHHAQDAFKGEVYDPSQITGDKPGPGEDA